MTKITAIPKFRIVFPKPFQRDDTNGSQPRYRLIEAVCRWNNANNMDFEFLGEAFDCVAIKKVSSGKSEPQWAICFAGDVPRRYETRDSVIRDLTELAKFLAEQLGIKPVFTIHVG